MDDEISYTGLDLGYWRVSTPDQDPQLQIDALKRSGIAPEYIAGEHLSGARMNRPVLRKVIDAAREGDCIVVWKLDRLGRSLTDVLLTVEELGKRNINVKSLTEPIDTTSPVGTLIMQILLAVAEMERALISERTKAGMAARRAQGVKFGKPHRIRDYPKRIEAFRELWVSGDIEGMTGQQVVDVLNKADKDAPKINVPQVFYNWRSKGMPGFDIPGEGAE